MVIHITRCSDTTKTEILIAAMSVIAMFLNFTRRKDAAYWTDKRTRYGYYPYILHMHINIPQSWIWTAHTKEGYRLQRNR